MYARLMSLGRSFNVLWGANAASNLADGLAFVSMPLLAASLTDDPRWVAGLATVYALVRLLAALPLGVWVDRADRRSLLAAANLWRGGAVLVLALCVSYGAGGLLLLYGAFAVIGILESAADNASVSLVPGIVASRNLDRANSRLSAAQLIADEFAGPPLGGFLFAVAAAAPVYAMGGLWAAAGFLALALPKRGLIPSRAGAAPAGTVELGAGGLSVAGTERTSLWKEAAAGIRWLAKHREVGGLALLGALASVGYMLPFSVLVLFAQQQLHVDTVGYGMILSVSALGGLAGSYAAPRIRRRLGYRWTVVASLLIGAGSLGALAATRSGVVAALLLAAYIFHAVVWGICATSIRQRLVPDDLRGRVNASSRVVGLLGLALGSALGGVLASWHIALPAAAGALVFVVCAAVAALLLSDVSRGTLRTVKQLDS
ncbi:MFS transporter [Arthrobacter sp. NPDC097144]|uniref:MFS transporter n=1 Tax=Arthrobacter sp. NPDC097144 TaxID=3363946 RepID=UPI003816B000